MAEYIVQKESLDAVANAIKTKAGMSESDQIVFPEEFVSTIAAISGGGSGESSSIQYTDIIYNDDDTVTLVDTNGNEHTISCTYENNRLMSMTYDGKEVVTVYDNDNLVSVGETEVDVSNAPLDNTLENLIDQSGVLDSTDGTVEEKVEQLIDKAEDENIWYEASKYISFQNQQSPFWNNRVAEKTIPKINFAENITTGYMYAFASTVIEYIDYYMDTKKGVEFGSCFAATKNLKWIKGINISNATQISDMFNGSSIERIIEPLDFTNVTNKNKWNYAPNLSDFRIVPESYKLSGDFPYSVYTSETIQSIIDGLAIVETAQTLTLHADVKAKLTQTQLATITSKNWNLA